MLSIRYFNIVPVLLAVALVLDQRIEIQLPLIVLLAFVAVNRRDAEWRPGKAALVLLVAVGYLVLNMAVMFLENVRVAQNWFAAPARVLVYYVLLIAMASIQSSVDSDDEPKFRTLEWLFILKIALIAFEGLYMLRTGEPRERPLFNIVLAQDALLGVRFTSSYDFLFSLFALSRRHQVRRLTILASAIIISETRAFFLLTALLFLWRILHSRAAIQLMFKSAVPVCLAVVAVLVLSGDKPNGVRLLQFSGSSANDKLEQLDSLHGLIVTPYMLTGQGLGVSLPGIIRDDARPYSYEAQVPVLLMQGGLLFFVVHAGIIWAYIRRHQVLALLAVFGLGMLNPTIFSLASAFFLVNFGNALDEAYDRRPQIRGPAVHA